MTYSFYNQNCRALSALPSKQPPSDNIQVIFFLLQERQGAIYHDLTTGYAVADVEVVVVVVVYVDVVVVVVDLVVLVIVVVIVVVDDDVVVVDVVVVLVDVEKDVEVVVFCCGC